MCVPVYIAPNQLIKHLHVMEVRVRNTAGDEAEAYLLRPCCILVIDLMSSFLYNPPA